MQTYAQMFGGGVLVAGWKKLSPPVRFLTIVALVAVTASEITVHVNTAIYSAAVKAGEAQDGIAKTSDPNKNLDLYRDRQPVSGSEALMGASVAEKAGNAGKVTAESQSMSESIDDIRAKVARGISITTTEKLQLIKVETALAELQAKEAEARKIAADAIVREAEATAAGQKAKADKAVSAYVQCIMEHGTDWVTLYSINDPCTHIRPF